MSLTAICHLQIKPEHQAEIVRDIAAQLASPAQAGQGRRFARVLQQVDDPNHLLYAGEWASREAFEAYRQQMLAPGRSDQFDQPPVCRCFQRLASFERVLVPIREAAAIVVDGPTESHAQRRALALAFHRTSPHSRSGIGMFVIHEALDEPPALLILAGWEARPATNGRPTPEQVLTDRLRQAGGWPTIFVGHALAQTTEF